MENMGKTSVKKYKALSTQKLQSGGEDRETERGFDAFEMHDNFLLAMEKLNRMKVSRSKEVDKELEKKEKGFTVYVNGANAKSKKNFVPKHAVTSGGGPSSNILTARTPRRVYNAFAEALISSAEPKSHRAASAPGRKRKFWGQGSVEIKESSGAVHKLSIPVTGLNYTEDFETEEDEEGNVEDSIEEIIERGHQSSDKYESDSTLSTADSVCSDPEAYFSDVGAKGVSNKNVDDCELGSLTNRMSPRTNITHKLPRKQPPSAIARSRSFSISSTRQSSSSKNLPFNNGNRNGETRVTKPPMPKLNLETSPNYSKTKAKEDKTVIKRKDKSSPRSQETFDSLLHFNRSHLGRLSTNTWTVDASQQQPLEDSKLPPVDEFSDDGEEEEEFTIPMLPTGKELVFNIHSTWGDLHYVGLNGIEIFTAEGVCADIEEVSADPPDINVLPEYSNDPRTFTNLINGKNQTCDDVNMWLVPYTAGAAHLVRLRLRHPATVAMIRVWNYNKSRIHSQRGAREISIHLDGQMLFSGEICKASGGTVRGDSFGDNILFTMDEAILAKIAQNDPFFEDNQHAYEYNDPFLPYNEGQRPTTGEEQQQQVEVDRPFTRANNEFAMSMDRMAGTYCAKCIELRIFSAWDGSDQAGLTGVIPLDEDCMPIEVTNCRVDIAHSNDRSYSLGDGGSLIDGNNFTTSADSMLLVDLPCNSSGGYLAVSISFVQAVQLSGLRIYNYNASYEDSYRGVKELEVYLDGKRPSSALRKPLLLRRAPGNVHYDYAQDVMFNGGASAFGDDDDDDAASDMPKGFVFKFELLDTWGDHYYVGLNGLQLFDGSGRMIELTDKEVTAFPSSVNILNPSVEDARTPDKLVDGVNDCPTGRHSWLAPFLPGQTNCIYVVFDQPVTVSKVRVWNYSKSASRGARNFTLFVDDLVIHSGVLTRAGPHHRQPDLILLDRGSRLQQQHQDNAVAANPLLFYNLSEENLSVKGKSKSRLKRRTARQVDQSKRPLTSMPKIKLRLSKNVLLH